MEYSKEGSLNRKTWIILWIMCSWCLRKYSQKMLYNNRINTGWDYKRLKTQYGLAWDETHTDGLVQGCSNSSTLAMELLQSCTKPYTIFNKRCIIFYMICISTWLFWFFVWLYLQSKDLYDLLTNISLGCFIAAGMLWLPHCSKLTLKHNCQRSGYLSTTKHELWYAVPVLPFVVMLPSVTSQFIAFRTWRMMIRNIFFQIRNLKSIAIERQISLVQHTVQHTVIKIYFCGTVLVLWQCYTLRFNYLPPTGHKYIRYWLLYFRLSFTGDSCNRWLILLCLELKIFSCNPVKVL